MRELLIGEGIAIGTIIGDFARNMAVRQTLERPPASHSVSLAGVIR